jgi:hypothetical protein
VDIDSTLVKTWPLHLTWMLSEGATIVRFTNTLNAFRQKMNFASALSLFGTLAPKLGMLSFVYQQARSAVVGLSPNKGTFVG